MGDLPVLSPGMSLEEVTWRCGPAAVDAALRLKQYLDDEFELLFLHASPSVFQLVATTVWSAMVLQLEEILLKSDAMWRQAGQGGMVLVHAIFTETLEHVHGDGLGLDRVRLRAGCRRLRRLFDLHFSSTRTLRQVFFAYKAKVLGEVVVVAGTGSRGDTVGQEDSPSDKTEHLSGTSRSIR